MAEDGQQRSYASTEHGAVRTPSPKSTDTPVSVAP